MRGREEGEERRTGSAGSTKKVTVSNLREMLLLAFRPHETEFLTYFNVIMRVNKKQPTFTNLGLPH